MRNGRPALTSDSLSCAAPIHRSRVPSISHAPSRLRNCAMFSATPVCQKRPNSICANISPTGSQRLTGGATGDERSMPLTSDEKSRSASAIHRLRKIRFADGLEKGPDFRVAKKCDEAPAAAEAGLRVGSDRSAGSAAPPKIELFRSLCYSCPSPKPFMRRELTTEKRELSTEY